MSRDINEKGKDFIFYNKPYILSAGLHGPLHMARCVHFVPAPGKVYGPAQICRCLEFEVPAYAPGIISNKVLLVIAVIILKRVANYIYIPIYSTISVIPTTLRYLPLLLVSENRRYEIITTDQSDAAFGLNTAEVSDFCKSALANSPAPLLPAPTPALVALPAAAWQRDGGVHVLKYIILIPFE